MLCLSARDRLPWFVRLYLVFHCSANLNRVYFLHHWVLVFGHVILWLSLNQKVGRLATWGLPFIVCHGFSCQLDRNPELLRKREPPFKNCLSPSGLWVWLWHFLDCLINFGRKALPTVGGAIPRLVERGEQAINKQPLFLHGPWFRLQAPYFCSGFPPQ